MLIDVVLALRALGDEEFTHNLATRKPPTRQNPDPVL
jgi:hypothetical protein